MKGYWVTALPMLECAYKNTYNVTVQASPFKLNSGMNSLYPASALPRREYHVLAALQFAVKMEEELKLAELSVCLMPNHV
jgi:hypothetical protein